MHVIIVGCGRVGSGLAHSCEERGHTVGIIDSHQKAFARLPAGFAGNTVLGVGFDRDRLFDAGIEQAGALAAVTSGDNSNILVARVARETFEVERVVARIKDPRRAAVYERLGIPTIATVQWATERILHRILPERPNVDWIDPSAKVMLIERPLPVAWAGRRVLELEIGAQSRVVALTRLGIAQIPTAELIAQEGDMVHVVVAGDSVDEFEHHLLDGAGAEPREAKH
ncbi:MAG: TrkA family potassium uptake protein [Acidimicrobiales bacterium]